jgi:hypothetical protein
VFGEMNMQFLSLSGDLLHRLLENENDGKNQSTTTMGNGADDDDAPDHYASGLYIGLPILFLTFLGAAVLAHRYGYFSFSSSSAEDPTTTNSGAGNADPSAQQGIDLAAAHNQQQQGGGDSKNPMQ